MKLSASRIDLARKCLWPFRRDAGPRNRSTFAAVEGNNEHDFIEHTLKTGDVTPKSPTHKRWLEEWYEYHGHLTWHTEVPVGLIPDQCDVRKGPEGWDHRDYSWSTWSHINGTVDAWTLDPEGVLRIVDWKTGEASHVDLPSKSGQMLFLGLAFWRWLRTQGQAVAAVSLEYVKVNDSRQWIESATVSTSDLLAFESELIELVERIDASPEPEPGWWCSGLFCDYRGRCPATAGALDAVAAWPEQQPFKFVLDRKDFTGPEHVRWQYLMLKAAAKRLEEAEEALKEQAREQAVDLGEGRFYGEREATRETIQADAPGVLEVLRTHLGERADGCVETKVTCSKSSIEGAAGELAKERKAAGEKVTKVGIERAVLADLHQIGAVKVTTFPELREFSVEKKTRKAKKAEAAPEAAPEADSGVALAGDMGDAA